MNASEIIRSWRLSEADRATISRNLDTVLALPNLRGVLFQIAGFTDEDYTVNTLWSGAVTSDELLMAGLSGLSDMLDAQPEGAI